MLTEMKPYHLVSNVIVPLAFLNKPGVVQSLTFEPEKRTPPKAFL